MKFTVERNWIDILGKNWMPGCTCALRKNLTKYDIENIGKPTRKNVQRWLDTNAGEFQSIIDFHVVIGEKEINWKSEENELTYLDCQPE